MTLMDYYCLAEMLFGESWEFMSNQLMIGLMKCLPDLVAGNSFII